MIKKLLSFFVGVFVLVALIVCVFLFLPLRNNIEPEIIAPKGDEMLPKISMVPNSKNYLIHPNYSNNSYVIHLPLPNEYIHKSNTSEKPVKSYSVSVTMYYPELKGKYHPENSNLPECNGYCGGYLSAFIEVVQKSADRIHADELQRLLNERKNNNELLKFEDLPSEFGMDDHFYIRHPVIERKSNGKKTSTDEIFVVRGAQGEVKYLFKCSPYVPSPACKTEFNLSSKPELLVSISFGRHLMSDWSNIIQSVDKKIESWGLVRYETK